MNFRVTVSYPLDRRAATRRAIDDARARLSRVAPAAAPRVALSAVSLDVALTVAGENEDQAIGTAAMVARTVLGGGEMRVIAQPADLDARNG